MNRNDFNNAENQFMKDERDSVTENLKELILQSEEEPSEFAWEKMAPAIQMDNQKYRRRKFYIYFSCGVGVLLMAACIYFWTNKESGVSSSEYVKTKNSSEKKEQLPFEEGPVENIEKKNNIVIPDKEIEENSVKENTLSDSIQLESKVQDGNKREEETLKLQNNTVNEKRQVDSLSIRVQEQKKKVELKDSLFEYKKLFRKK